MTPKKGYYNENTIRKFAEAIQQAKIRFDGGELENVHFSAANSKMGAVASVSLVPFATCPARCATTCGAYCYAAKLANLRANVLKAYAENTVIALYRPASYWAQIRDFVRGVRFFRFHVAGDIVNDVYFAEMVKTAESAPHCEFLAFTKRYEAVNTWIDAHGVENLPENLHILFSGEKNLKPVNPYNLPETTIFERDEEPREDWKLCGGNCFECGCRGVGCWQLQRGDVLAFRKH